MKIFYSLILISALIVTGFLFQNCTDQQIQQLKGQTNEKKSDEIISGIERAEHIVSDKRDYDIDEEPIPNTLRYIIENSENDITIKMVFPENGPHIITLKRLLQINGKTNIVLTSSGQNVTIIGNGIEIVNSRHILLKGLQIRPGISSLKERFKKSVQSFYDPSETIPDPVAMHFEIVSKIGPNTDIDFYKRLKLYKELPEDERIYRDDDILEKLKEYVILVSKMDALSIKDSQSVRVEHCSLSWGTDEVLSISGETSNDILISDTIIAQGLKNSGHNHDVDFVKPTDLSRGLRGHSKSSIVAMAPGGNITFKNNIFMTSNERNIRPASNVSNGRQFTINFINNIIYNYGNCAGLTNTESESVNVKLNMIRNTYILGSTKLRNDDINSAEYKIDPRPSKHVYNACMMRPMKALTKLYLEDNEVEDSNMKLYAFSALSPAMDNSWNYIVGDFKINEKTVVKNPISMTEDELKQFIHNHSSPNSYTSTPMTRDEAKVYVLRNAGPTYRYLTKRNAVDEALINHVINKTGNLISHERDFAHTGN